MRTPSTEREMRRGTKLEKLRVQTVRPDVVKVREPTSIVREVLAAERRLRRWRARWLETAEREAM
jgi:hypothetical protein